jgi:hypothetical protein
MIIINDSTHTNEPMVPFINETAGGAPHIPRIYKSGSLVANLIDTEIEQTGHTGMLLNPGIVSDGIIHPQSDYNEDTGYLNSGATGTHAPVYDLVSMYRTYLTNNAPRIHIDSSGNVDSWMWLFTDVSNNKRWIVPFSFNGSGVNFGGDAIFNHHPCVTRGIDDPTDWGYDLYKTNRESEDMYISPERAWYLSSNETRQSFLLKAYLNVGHIQFEPSLGSNITCRKCAVDQLPMSFYFHFWYTWGMMYDYPEVYYGIDGDRMVTLHPPRTTRAIYPPAHPFSHPYHIPVDITFGQETAIDNISSYLASVRYRFFAWMVIDGGTDSASESQDAFGQGSLMIPVNIGTVNNYVGETDPETTTAYMQTSLRNKATYNLGTGDYAYQRLHSSARSYNSIINAQPHHKVWVYKALFETVVTQGLNTIEQPRLLLPASLKNASFNVLGWGLEVIPYQIEKTTPWLKLYSSSERVPNYEYNTKWNTKTDDRRILDASAVEGEFNPMYVITRKELYTKNFDNDWLSVTSSEWKKSSTWQPNAYRSWDQIPTKWFSVI